MNNLSEQIKKRPYSTNHSYLENIFGYYQNLSDFFKVECSVKQGSKFVKKSSGLSSSNFTLYFNYLMRLMQLTKERKSWLNTCLHWSAEIGP
ncbi:hypothetical protein BpHYR1_029681 [Brachionus plicatilis]|uniref:Uncharacterized protein n=1 Tax=Brachionus plicatilis TaxID=10195 RepID=A0A3M7SCE8_BRAPC|nr:hypothetical protein BpHYR1_029681 [Brachionus plicatilis]